MPVFSIVSTLLNTVLGTKNIFIQWTLDEWMDKFRCLFLYRESYKLQKQGGIASFQVGLSLNSSSYAYELRFIRVILEETKRRKTRGLKPTILLYGVLFTVYIMLVSPFCSAFLGLLNICINPFLSPLLTYYLYLFIFWWLIYI